MALISVAEALDHVLAHATPLPPETVPLDAALHRVLAVDTVLAGDDSVLATAS